MTLLYAVIPVKNQIKYTRDLVGQLLQQGEGRVLLIDNGSTDGTRTWADEVDDPNFSWSDANGMNIHKMWNFGLELARGQSGRQAHSIALLNNDLRIGPSFLSRLDSVLRMDPRICVAGACYDQRKWPAGTRAQAVESVCAARYDGTGGLPGFAMMLRGEDGYRFPEELHWWFGDTDLVFTMRQHGKLCVIAKDATCEHLDGGGRTGDWSSPQMQPLLRADRLWFEKKWGVRA